MSLRQISSARRWMTGYWACAVIHVVAVACDVTALRRLSKAALMPSLAAWVRAQEGPPLLIAALLASAAGDLLMELKLLLPAMALYAAAHACYIALFLPGRTRAAWQAVAAYGVLGLAVLLMLWPGLGLYRAPVAVYALMLMATAVTSLWYGDRAGLGGALFVVSDSLIGVQLAGHDFRTRGSLVMATYGIGQYQLAAGALRGHWRRLAAASGPGLQVQSRRAYG
ncbi:MAG TPA: lysoplasmalogenase [Kribbella sp.]|nr:lysoplasmalogenase [Kribbella sp.]